MKEQKKPTPMSDEPAIPAGQKLFDNMFLWLILSFLISGLIYNAWGLIEVFTLPHLTQAAGG